MLKGLISFWQDDSELKHIFSRFDEMLLIGKGMFQNSSSAIFKPPANRESFARDLIKSDSKINTLQQVIRRDIITHISVNGIKDILPCLLLVSLVKDAERIGDYSKNIFEVATHAPTLKDDPLAGTLREMSLKIPGWFDKTTQAFNQVDGNLARITREEAYALEKECDRQVWSLSADNKGRNAVAIALQFRFFKRVAAHLGNVCTSVVMPFDKVDYYDKIPESQQ